MKNEIKEILDKLDYIISRTEDDILVNDYGIEIENYITNLQKENDSLNSYYEYYKDLADKQNKLMRDYKLRCEKAIEYIKENQDMSYYGAVVNTKMEIILNILGGKNE